MRTFAIEPNHPLVQSWATLHDDIQAVLEQQSLSYPWRAIEVFRRRRTLRPSPEGIDDTTVLVTIEKGADDDHRAILARSIKAICGTHGQPTLQVEVLEGLITRLASPMHPHTKSATPGSSIGVAGLDWSSGTLGGYVTLRSSSTEERVLCALTCHHVLRPTRIIKPAASSPPPSPPYDSKLDVVGCYHPAIEKPDPSLKVQQPSTADHHTACEALTSQLAETDAKIVRHEENLEMGMESAAGQRGLEVARERRETYQRLRAEIDSFDRNLGHVWATSGYRTAAAGCAIDWGLVRVDKRREGYNEVKSTPHIVPSFTGKLKKTDMLKCFQLPTFQSSRIALNVVGKIVDTTAKMSLGDTVILFGKVSGMTLGTFSAIKSSVSWSEHKGLTTECVVAGVDGHAFADFGDSGGFVMNKSGALVGLLIAGSEGKGTGYVTPIQAIWDDIRTQTGREIELD